ncbi:MULTISPECIES: hypothetical protein [Parafrankia]|uniref:hypothetical protein n=1 Tax=Parafrankia TaxID=2994362 RepID=UPI001041F763|nr:MULTISPECIES: hypothetical protein [Parafrankia]MBE3200167.1 hypothetical protein [Parafrankia sp. CH37]
MPAGQRRIRVDEQMWAASGDAPSAQVQLTGRVQRLGPSPPVGWPEAQVSIGGATHRPVSSSGSMFPAQVGFALAVHWPVSSGPTSVMPRQTCCVLVTQRPAPSGTMPPGQVGVASDRQPGGCEEGGQSSRHSGRASATHVPTPSNRDDGAEQTGNEQPSTSDTPVQRSASLTHWFPTSRQLVPHVAAGRSQDCPCAGTPSSQTYRTGATQVRPLRVPPPGHVHTVSATQVPPSMVHSAGQVGVARARQVASSRVQPGAQVHVVAVTHWPSAGGPPSLHTRSAGRVQISPSRAQPPGQLAVAGSVQAPSRAPAAATQETSGAATHCPEALARLV